MGRLKRCRAASTELAFGLSLEHGKTVLGQKVTEKTIAIKGEPTEVYDKREHRIVQHDKDYVRGEGTACKIGHVAFGEGELTHDEGRHITFAGREDKHAKDGQVMTFAANNDARAVPVRLDGKISSARNGAPTSKGR